VKGDRGASSLDWAIMTGQKVWGVTILQAAAEMDAGPIWASHNFSLPGAPLSKSSLYRQQVTEAAVRGVLEAVEKFRTFREIVYREEGEVGFLSFDFYNGAMSTSQCRRLRDAFLHARSRPTKVIVLLGGSDFWSNGIHLNVIEASAKPAEESWWNINAIDDFVYEIINCFSHLVIAGLRGNAGAGGAILALAADRLYAKSGVVLNPHYRSMGGLFGSEYWTYLLPRRVGQAKALELTQSCKPLGAKAACEIGFLDDAFGSDVEAFETELRRRAQLLARNPEFSAMLRKKHEIRMRDEQLKPLAIYRSEELERMGVNFFGRDPAYHEARRRFVFKGNPPRDLAPILIGASGWWALMALVPIANVMGYVALAISDWPLDRNKQISI